MWFELFKSRRFRLFSSFIFCLSSLFTPLAHAEGTTQPQPLSERVQSIFATHCAECHGEAVAHPRGNFGYVTDLARVAGDKELVVAGKPNQSPLWQMVKSGEMPARGAKAGALSADEKDAIRKWIESGAPLPNVASSSK